MLKKLLVTAFFIPLSTLASPSQELTNSEQKLCQSTECRDKYQQLRKLGVHGSPTAQLLVGLAYLKGDGLEQDIERGLSWLQKAKRSGSTKATWLLSQLYREGKLVEQDISRADYLLNLAVERGYGPALYEKAVSLIDLNGNKDQEAISLLKQSKKTGFKQANYLYAKLLETGTVIDKDLYQSALAYRNLGNYRDSKTRFTDILKDADNQITRGDKQKFSYLADMEVITVEHNSASFEGYVDKLVSLLKADGRYDGRGGMSNLAGRVCSNANGCDMVIGEDLDYYRYGAATKRYPTQVKD